MRNYRTEYLKSKRGLRRHPIIGDTTLSAMHRFLKLVDVSGCAAPAYSQQWTTFLKAERLDYVTKFGGKLTTKGRVELTKLNATKEAAK